MPLEYQIPHAFRHTCEHLKSKKFENTNKFSKALLKNHLKSLKFKEISLTLFGSL